MREAHNRIPESTNSVAHTQKSYFDKHVNGPKFAVDHVWLYWPRPLVRQKNKKKLTQIWTGPWLIQQLMSLLVVKIKHPKQQNSNGAH